MRMSPRCRRRKRRKVSAYTANKSLRYLRAAIRFGIRKGFISIDPTKGLGFFPVEKKIKYVPPADDLDKVIALADQDNQDYLWAIRETMARVGEINRLKWDDVNLNAGYVILYTRKKAGGNLTPRKVPMTGKLREVLSRRYQNRDDKKPWVFWRVYKNPKSGKKWVGPFNYRREILMSLCDKAQVRYFSYHAIRHAGASLMDHNNAPIGAIQKILGHENRRTTEIYLHSIDDAEAEAIAIYEAARQKSHTSHTQNASSGNEKGVNRDG